MNDWTKGSPIDVWQFVCARKRVSKHGGLWELALFDGVAWVPVMWSIRWERMLWAATGDPILKPSDRGIMAKMVWQP